VKAESMAAMRQLQWSLRQKPGKGFIETVRS